MVLSEHMVSFLMDERHFSLLCIVVEDNGDYIKAPKYRFYQKFCLLIFGGHHFAGEIIEKVS